VIVGPATKNDAAVVAVPMGFDTLIGPVVAPDGTVVVILPFVTTTNELTPAPWKRTVVVPKKPEPKMETGVPTWPLCGENPVMTGAVMVTTLKFVALVAVPAGVVSVIFPLVAPGGTVALTCASETNTNDAATPWNLTDVTPEKCVPLIVTVVPAAPNVGLKLEINGAPAPSTVKLPALCAVPPGVTTVTLPVVAPAGTVALICVPAAFTENPAPIPLKRTADVPAKRDPLMLTLDPTAPLVGLSPVMMGTPIVMVKLLPLVAGPFGPDTVMGPVVAPGGTVALICVPAGRITVKLAEVPLNVTDDVPMNPVPLTVTLDPAAPLAGVKLVMLGGAPAEAGRDMTDAKRATTTAAVPMVLDGRAVHVRLI
jgi:hypothetical protein